ncbi:ImmA/IrrE family metallo-endopeptidase [Peptostreptococcus porci]|uniref:ImmA/IrrE family metallo-endopeptidase n=1 Tax=Peptostreptococcus porci TaxID=2652282 RepID=UPI0023F26E32|nr:hypothetical protein [Peptostreptococcus porci]MDD7182356.1 hypothetical protein [Peptostreptococcus porci]
MSMLEKIYKYIDEKNIKLKYVDSLEENHDIKGLFYSDNENNIILIDTSVKSDTLLHNNILSEEVGHYATSVGDTTKKIDTENYRVIVEKSERKADKWRCNFLIPDEDLKKAIINCDSISEIAEYLFVDTEIVFNKLKYISYTNNTFKVNDSITIDLLQLPNLVKICNEY